MATCKCRQPVPMQSQVSMYICASCSEKIVGPDPRDAEIAALKAEVEQQSVQIEALHVEHEKAEARWKRALAAGPAALRGSIYDGVAEMVLAAQEAAMKDDDKKGGG